MKPYALDAIRAAERTKKCVVCGAKTNGVYGNCSARCGRIMVGLAPRPGKGRAS